MPFASSFEHSILMKDLSDISSPTPSGMKITQEEKRSSATDMTVPSMLFAPSLMYGLMLCALTPTYLALSDAFSEHRRTHFHDRASMELSDSFFAAE